MIQSLSLFPDAFACAPDTEGIKYAGSKLKLLPYILGLAQKVDAHTILDGFAGTTRVSQAFAKSGYEVIANDRAVWSEVFGTCYLLNQKPASAYRELINHLNAVAPVDGWFSENYGGEPNDGCAVQHDGLKKPWQNKNTRKLDGILGEFEKLNLSGVERAVAQTSLILALDQVDSTIGHQASYLQAWAPRSYNDMVLKVPAVFTTSKHHRVIRNDIFETLPKVSADLAYYDPPYGSCNEKMPPSRVRYAAYYHLWATICLNDRPALFGKAKRRADTSDTVAGSAFEDFRKDTHGRFLAVEAIRRLLAHTHARWIILSYSSGGRATAAELNEVIAESGKVIEILEIDYKKNVMADMKWTNDWVRDVEAPNREFLFLIEKS